MGTLPTIPSAQQQPARSARARRLSGVARASVPSGARWREALGPGQRAGFAPVGPAFQPPPPPQPRKQAQPGQPNPAPTGLPRAFHRLPPGSPFPPGHSPWALAPLSPPRFAGDTGGACSIVGHQPQSKWGAGAVLGSRGAGGVGVGLGPPGSAGVPLGQRTCHEGHSEVGAGRAGCSRARPAFLPAYLSPTLQQLCCWGGGGRGRHSPPFRRSTPTGTPTGTSTARTLRPQAMRVSPQQLVLGSPPPGAPAASS